MPLFDAVEQAFLDYLGQGHSRTAASGWLGFTREEFEERIQCTDGLSRAVKIAEAQAQFRLESLHISEDNKTSTRNTLTELTNRYPGDWGKRLPMQRPQDGESQGTDDKRLAPNLDDIFSIGQEPLIEDDIVLNGRMS